MPQQPVAMEESNLDNNYDLSVENLEKMLVPDNKEEENATNCIENVLSVMPTRLHIDEFE